MMLITTDTGIIIVTEDKKCILRGHDRSDYMLCLVGENSELPVTTFKDFRSAKQYAENNPIMISTKVASEYAISYMFYHNNCVSPLIAVETNIQYEISKNYKKVERK